MRLLIQKGRVIDPESGTDEVLDVLVREGRIEDIAANISLPGGEPADILDAENMVVAPGLIDMHTHLREPGFEYKETVQTGAGAAAAGGFTAVACMANTCPVNDSASTTKYILEKAREKACVHVLPVGAVTMGLQGTVLTEMGDLKDAGCIAVSDDGMCIASARMMRLGLEYARSFSLPVISHCQDPELSADGCMHEGITAMKLGLHGIPSSAEDIMVARDSMIAEWSGCGIHIAHVSTAGAVRIIRESKKRGVLISAETAPHYFTLTDESVAGYDTAMKMYPPLRSAADVQAVKDGLSDGTIDAIASDHAPHSSLEKDVEFDKAAFGIVGLETALPLSLQLVRESVLTLPRLIAAMSANPARILNIDKGRLQRGAAADLTVFDPQAEWTVDKNSFRSKSRNTPFHGWQVRGRACYTIVDGSIVYSQTGR